MSERNKRISEKLSLLRREGEPQKKAVAMAINMEKSHRLGRHGAYRRAAKSSSRKSTRTSRRR